MREFSNETEMKFGAKKMCSIDNEERKDGQQ